MKNRFDLSDALASSMDQALNSEENKSMFSTSGMLEKLAFSKVSEENVPTELANELEVELAGATITDPSTIMNATASKKCECGKAGCECEADKCDCNDTAVMASRSEDMLTKVAYNTLLKASEELESAGFESLAAESLALINRLVVEAKKKKTEKSKSKTDKDSKKSKEDKKKKDEKKKKEESKSSSKESTKKSSK